MIAIAGAGIGGLALGCALHHLGQPFRIFEKSPALVPAGAGIALADNALRALEHTGHAAAVRAEGLPIRRAEICDPRGRVIAGVGELPFPVLVMPRTALQRALLGPIAGAVECGRTVAGYDQDASDVLVRFDDGASLRADLLIAADGLHSAVRRVMRGAEPPRYSGQTSWRAIVEATVPERMTESWGPGLRFGIVPLRQGLVYWFAVATAPAGGTDGADIIAELRQRFAGWHAPIDDLLARTPAASVLRTDIYDRRPIRKWIDGRVALLGDAAHPMTPNLGMGGCQAIEDAAVLADAIATGGADPGALLAYQRRRLKRANGFVERSFVFGRIAQTRHAPVRWLRDRALSAIPRSLALRALKQDLDFRL